MNLRPLLLFIAVMALPILNALAVETNEDGIPGLAAVQLPPHAFDLPPKQTAEFRRIAKTIRAASTVALFEGLPHPAMETPLFKSERAARKTIRVHGFWFYRSPLKLSAEEVASLRRLSTSVGSYQRRYPKLCPPFHPDYCLEWGSGHATVQLLVCFGCREVMLHGEQGELWVDLEQTAAKAFEQELRSHGKYRPPHKRQE